MHPGDPFLGFRLARGLPRFPQDATKLAQLIWVVSWRVEDAALSLSFKRHDGGQNRLAWP